jgi:Tfp pilus assembly protein PilO
MSIFTTPKINSTTPAGPTKVRNSALEIVLMLIVIGVVYQYLVKPKQVELMTAQENYTKADGERQEAEKTKSALSSLQAQLENQTAKIAVLDESLPLSSRITRTYLELQQLVTDAAMTPGNIQVDQTVDQAAVNIDLSKVFAKPRKLASLKISLNVIGSIQDFQGLLETIESQNRVYNIDSVDIQPERDNVFAFHIQMKTYVYVPDAITPNTAAGAISTPTTNK